MALNLKADDIKKSLGIEKEKENAKKRKQSTQFKSMVTSPATEALDDNGSVKGETDQIIAKKIGVGTTTYKEGKNVHKKKDAILCFRREQ